MADNVEVSSDAEYVVATNELGDASQAQGIQLLASDAATADDRVPASETDGLLVNLGGNNDVTITGTVPVSGPLTDAQLRATPVPVDVSDTTFAATVADGADVALGATSDAASANTVIGRLKNLLARWPAALGQTTKTGSLPVTIASDQDALAVSGTVTASDGGGTLTVDDGGLSLTVDGTVAVSGLSGTVAVTQSGTWDEVGINDSGNSITVDDGGSTISIDDGGGIITVDGTVAVSGTVTVDSELTTGDLDTGAGTDTRAVVGLVGSKSGGGVLIPGDATAGLKVDLGADNDVTVTGTVTASLASGTNNIGDVDVITLPSIPAGNNNIGDVDVASLPALAAGNNNIGDVDVATIAAGDNNIGNVDIVTLPNVTLAAGTNTNEVVGDVAQDVAVAGNPVLVGMRASDAEPTAMTADGRAVYAWADRSGRTVVGMKAVTATLSNVGDSASNVTVLASNAARLGATVVNDSTAVLYLKMGATASATSYTVKMQPDDYYEVPYGYTGVLEGLWASDAGGSARVTELT